MPRWLSWLLCIAVGVHGQEVSWTPLRPHAVPIAVKSPYLNSWLRSSGDNDGKLTQQWVSHWLGDDHQWAGLVVVDGEPYSWMYSIPWPPPATQKSVTITATRTIFELTAGTVDLVVTFLSPIELDLLTASMPFSYCNVEMSSNDGREHTVSLYTDVSSWWLIGRDIEQNRTATTGELYVNETITIQSASLAAPEHFKESSHFVLEGDLLYAVDTPEDGRQMSFMSGDVNDVRNEFLRSQSLENTVDEEARPLNDHPLGLAFAHTNMRVAQHETKSTLFAIGFARSPAILYLDTPRWLYFYSAYASHQDALTAFLRDYAAATRRAESLDRRLRSQALAVAGENYAALLDMSLRQAFAAHEITIGGDPQRGFDTDDVMIFLEETGSAFVNTADVIFPLMPALLWYEPQLLKFMLEPLLRAQEIPGGYPFQYAMHDLSSWYPNASGRPLGDDEQMPVENSGNMIIMALAVAQWTGDLSQLRRYYNLFDQWGTYLVQNGLYPGEQLSTDDFADTLANQTNLAIKALVATQAMSVISKMLGRQNEASNYADHASRLTREFLANALSSDRSHIMLNYGNGSSWVTSYNMYPDRLLDLGLFPKSLYETQDEWYRQVNLTYGLPLDSREAHTKSDWACWAAAMATSIETRDMIIKGIVDYVRNIKDEHSYVLTDLYWTETGFEDFLMNRPVVGGHFALLALHSMHRPFLYASGMHAYVRADSLAPLSVSLLALAVVVFLMRDRFDIWRRYRGHAKGYATVPSTPMVPQLSSPLIVQDTPQ